MLQYILYVIIYVICYSIYILYVRVYIIWYWYMIPSLQSAGSFSDRIKAKVKRKKYLKFKLLGKTTIFPEAKKNLISTSVTWGKYRLKIFINEHRPLVF